MKEKVEIAFAGQQLQKLCHDMSPVHKQRKQSTNTPLPPPTSSHYHTCENGPENSKKLMTILKQRRGDSYQIKPVTSGVFSVTVVYNGRLSPRTRKLFGW